GIFIAIEPIVDMARTALNVNGSMMSGVLANRILNNHTADDMPALLPEFGHVPVRRRACSYLK
ncbi:L-cystine transporter, partial [Salmonella enterica subsp. enterica serovar Anatum]|nr:L-cystine transporter [Salmonella enterica subsp. enterica serovar Anatum]